MKVSFWLRQQTQCVFRAVDQIGWLEISNPEVPYPEDMSELVLYIRNVAALDTIIRACQEAKATMIPAKEGAKDNTRIVGIEGVERVFFLHQRNDNQSSGNEPDNNGDR